MTYTKICFIALCYLLSSAKLSGQCPTNLKPLNAQKIKYEFQDLADDIPLSITYKSKVYPLDRSGNSHNFFSDNFINPDDAQLDLIVNYDKTHEECVYSTSGERSGTAPVELSLFTAKLSGEDIELHWITQMEENNAAFEVQQSFDGETFNTVAFLAGAGNSNVAVGYHFLDYKITERAEQPTVYYRLQQFDFDGASEYSGVIAVDIDVEKDEFKITKVSGWNSESGHLQIFYSCSAFVKQVQAILANHGGQIYDQRVLRPEPGHNQYDVNVQRYKSPIYIISLNNGRTIISEKIALAAGY